MSCCFPLHLEVGHDQWQQMRLNLEAVLANHSTEIVSSYQSLLPGQSHVMTCAITKCIYWKGSAPLI